MGKPRGQKTSAPPAGFENHFLWQQLSNVIAMRTSQDNVIWTIFSIFWAANAVLLGVLFQHNSIDSDRPAGFVVSLVGVAMALIWWFIQYRALSYIAEYEALIHNIQGELERIHPDFKHYRIYKGNTNNQTSWVRAWYRLRARHVMVICSVGWFIGWSFSIGYFS